MRGLLIVSLVSSSEALQLPQPLRKLAKEAASCVIAAGLLTPVASNAVIVDASGNVAKQGIELVEKTVALPMTTGLQVTRKAEAVVFSPKDPKGGVVFLHGFSQRPANYKTLLRSIAASGLEVVAPRTWLFSTAFAQVETVPWYSSPAGKLQTALLIDGLRSLDLLQNDVAGGPLSVAGHSMGGAMALVVPSLTSQELSSVFVMSPAAADSTKTELNPYLTDDTTQYEKLFRAYQKKTNLVLVAASQDKIVPPNEVHEIYNAAQKVIPSTAITDILVGSHVGYEDSLEVRLGGLTKAFFSLLDYIIYRADLYQNLSGVDYPQQLATTKILLAHLNAAFSNTNPETADAIVFPTNDGPPPVWSTIVSLTTSDPTLMKILKN